MKNCRISTNLRQVNCTPGWLLFTAWIKFSGYDVEILKNVFLKDADSVEWIKNNITQWDFMLDAYGNDHFDNQEDLYSHLISFCLDDRN